MKRTLRLVSCLMMAGVFASCASINNRFYQGDVIGFSNTPTTSYTEARGVFMNMKHQNNPYDLRDANGFASLETEIKSVQRGDNTTAYYAMELAANRIKYVRRKIAKNDPNTKYYIFLLTDGLDNASPEVAKDEKMFLFHRTPEQYQKRVHNKLKSAMGFWNKNLFEVYPMLYLGSDLKETQRMNGITMDSLKRYMANEMECFRYSTRGQEHAPEVYQADNFADIMRELEKRFRTSTYTFRVPKSYAGKEIRMNILMKGKNGQTTKIPFLTARMKKSLFSYTLTDIEFHNGFSATLNESKTIKSYDEGVNAFFVLTNLRYENEAYYPKPADVSQDYKSTSGVWQMNSEYREVTEQAIDTYFILVIDGSSSLDGKGTNNQGFKEETGIALKLIKILNPNFNKSK